MERARRKFSNYGWEGREFDAFWMSALTNILVFGGDDILITANNNLNRFIQIIKNVFPGSKTRIL